jgi:sugar/nucleoside kinase (ribokinase family)
MKRRVVVVGGANGERFLRVDAARLQTGRKYTAAPSATLPGGSGVNYACRLLAAGVDVSPTLPIADDAVGRMIVEAIEAAAAAGRAHADLAGIFVEGEGVSTPFSTILASSEQRTVFNEFAPAMLAAFERHCTCRTEAALSEEPRPDALIIGHIHADTADGGAGGAISEKLIQSANHHGLAVLLNPGSAQYTMGVSRWEGVFPLVDCLQIDIHEMRVFAAELGITRLYDALEWFGERCTTVITLERAGAVARLRGSSRAVISWPFSLSSREVVDPTGAGDACMAGVAASAIEAPLRDDASLLRAAERGMLWAAHACMHLGGAAECPTTGELQAFHDEHPELYHTELRTMDEARPLLRLLDRIFPVTPTA